MAFTKKQTGPKILFSVDDFDVYEKGTYIVGKKIDRSAPKELVLLGVSKYPGTSETVFCPFNREGGLYDTGFYEASPMYFGMNSVEVKETVKARIENVLKPFLAIKGLDENKFTPSDLDSWDEFSVNLHEDRILSMTSPEKVMELYVALIGKKLTPPGFEESSEYGTSSFMVFNMNEDNSKRRNNDMKEMEADGIFSGLYKTNIQKLTEILSYIDGIRISESPAEDTLYAVYKKMVKPDPNKLDKFLETYDKADDVDGALEVKLHRIIEIASNNKEPDFNKVKGAIIYKGKELGKNAKDAAYNLVETKNKELLELKDELVMNAEDR